MRNLTPTELEKINNRLKFLQIHYNEIRDEIKDHYISELEKNSTDEFEAIVSKLNEAFSPSIIRKMEKSLEKSTKKLISQMQWDELKFWNRESNASPYPILALVTLGLCYFYLDVEGMTLLLGTIALLGIPVTWYAIGKELYFSKRKFVFQSSKVFEEQFFNRSGIFLGGISYLYLTYMNWNDSNPGVVGTILLWLISIPMLLYILTLIQVGLKRKSIRIKTSTK